MTAVRSLLGRARYVALLFPLYGVLSSVAQGCGGTVDDASSSDSAIHKPYGYGYGCECSGDPFGGDGYGYGYGYGGDGCSSRCP